jgi:hypothetical protein
MTGQGDVINRSSPVQLSTGNSTPVSWTFVATDRNIGVGKREPKGKDDVQAAKGNFGELD